PTPPLAVRPAQPADAAAIAEIYNQGIRDRIATFETRERTAEEVAHWLGDPRHPLLVGVVDDRIVGWVGASAYRPRECYAGVGDLSIYVARGERGRGVGDALLGNLLSACRAAGLWKLVARVFPENEASLALCARYGFRRVGVYERHAKLEGVWRDVVIVERL